MKQNERLLVYAVTGFLAIILVIAVLFGPSGRDAAGASKAGVGEAQGLSQILGQKSPAESAVVKDGEGAKTSGEVAPLGTASGLPSPGHVSPQQPLVANEKPLVTADLLAQTLGQSRKDRTVRIVRAQSGDSLEQLVRRWCGARDPYLAEAKSLNEDLVVLRVGQEVCVPWVDDEIVLAAAEARKPKVLTGSDDVGPVGSSPPAALGTGLPAGVGASARPTFAEPGARDLGARDPGARDLGAPKVGGAAASYTVKDGDSLWKIADRTYGRKNAARMIGEIRKANPALEDALHPGQKLVLPPAPADGS